MRDICGAFNMEKGSAVNSKFFPIFEKNYRPKRKPDPLLEIQTVLDKCQENDRIKKRKNLLGKKETPGLTQMILDAGQKVIGPVHCTECGLLYSPGDIEDELEHRKAHSRLENLFTIRLWKNAKIVWNSPVEASMILEVDCEKESKRVMNSLRNFLGWIDLELGANDDVSGTRPTEKVYLYVVRTKRKDELRILGCTIVESIDKDKVICEPLCPEMKENSNTQLTLGITRLWTDALFRRRHIARRLCDVLRATYFVPASLLPTNQIGILEPSEDGKAFMIRYTHGHGLQYTYKSL